MKSENTPSEDTIAPGKTISLTTRFGGCSRGKCWGKYYANQIGPIGDFEWVEKSNGTLHLSGPGYYVVGSGDGFSREARGEFCLKAQDNSPAGKLKRQREMLAKNEAKEQESPGGTLIAEEGNALSLPVGTSYPRADLIAWRKAKIAELEAEISGVVSAHIDQATI